MVIMNKIDETMDDRNLMSRKHDDFRKTDIKVFPEGLMVNMASKNISRCTVSYTALPMKTDLHFQPTLS